MPLYINFCFAIAAANTKHTNIPKKTKKERKTHTCNYERRKRKEKTQRNTTNYKLKA